MKRSIVVVDDDASIRAALNKILIDCGYDVRTAANGIEARDCLHDTPANIVLLDLDMPLRDGWDVLDDIRSEHPALPVIILTGMFDQLATYDIPGVAALMAKPVNAQVLLDEIQHLVGASSPCKTTRVFPPEKQSLTPILAVARNHLISKEAV